MNGHGITQADTVRTQLRSLLATMGEQIGRLPLEKVFVADGGSIATSLTASWADLVKRLDLGPEPALRDCPVCASSGMRAATLCGSCWSPLTPPEEPARVTP